MAPEDRDGETTGLLRSGQRSERPAPLCLSYRLLVTLLNMAAMMLCFANQSSMGSTMVCMKVGEAVNVTDIIINTTTTTDFSVYNIATTIAGAGNGTELPPYKYDWDKTIQGWIHSSLFIGYYVTLLPSGILATRYGGKRLAVCGLFVSSLAQLATPLSAVAGVWWLCFVRAVCGFASGFVYAPIFGVLANWVPAAESSLLFGLAGTGMELGAVISFSLSSLFCESDVAGGWPLTYYVIGGLGLVTTLTFALIVSDVPSQNRWISRRERHYIEVAVGEAGGHGHKDQNDKSALTNTIPIRSILTSVPVWAIVVSQTGSDWLYYLLITVMPNFMDEVMKLPSTTITLVTGLPFLAIIPTIYVTGSLADFLRRKKILSTTAVRKLADFICKIFPGAILLGLTFLGPGQESEFVVLYLLTCILTAFIYLSWITNPVDLSPAYTGFITSICETGSMWIAIVVPIVVENLTKDKTVSQWRLVFTISFGIQVVTFLFYVTFGSSVLQPWGRPDAAPPGAVTHTADGNSKLPPASAERRRGRRKKSNFSASDSEVGRVKVYRSISSFASDAEDEQTSHNTREYQPPGARLNGHIVVSPRQRPPSSLAASNPLYQDCVTSEWDNRIYVTMTRSASASDSAAEEEDIYESMDFGSAAAALQRSGAASAAEKECPMYENVSVDAGPPVPSFSTDCSSSVPSQQSSFYSLPTSTSRDFSSSIPPQQSSSGSVRTSASGEWNSVGNISERSARESLSYGTFGRT